MSLVENEDVARHRHGIYRCKVKVPRQHSTVEKKTPCCHDHAMMLFAQSFLQVITVQGAPPYNSLNC